MRLQAARWDDGGGLDAERSQRHPALRTVLRPDRRTVLRRMLGGGAGLVLAPVFGAALAQTPTPLPPQSLALPVATPLTELLTLPSLDAVLAKLQPPANKTQITKSDYLLLDVPEIALAGQIEVRMMSEIPGTDLFLLFDNSLAGGASLGGTPPGVAAIGATPQGVKPPLLAVQPVTASAKAVEAKVRITLTATTELLLLARANGRLVSAVREVKLAVKDKK